MNTIILNPIGKGQITIPVAWRKKIGIDKTSVVVELREDTKEIVLKAVAKPDWDVKQIALNDLSKADQKQIKIARGKYKKGQMDSFLSFEEVFGK